MARSSTTFAPGQVTNPRGRPKEAAEVKALARKYGPEAIEKLAELMRSSDPRTMVAACKELLDRGYGKPEQSLDIQGEITKYVIRVPAVTTSAEEWAEQHKPKIQ